MIKSGDKDDGVIDVSAGCPLLRMKEKRCHKQMIRSSDKSQLIISSRNAEKMFPPSITSKNVLPPNIFFSSKIVIAVVHLLDSILVLYTTPVCKCASLDHF